MSNVWLVLAWNLLLVVPLATGVWLVTRFPALRRRPATCHLLWLLVLAKFVLPPLVAVPAPKIFGNDSAVASATEEGRSSTSQKSSAAASTAMVHELSKHDAAANASFATVAPSAAAEKAASLDWRALLGGAMAASGAVTLAAWLVAVRQYRRTNLLLQGHGVDAGRAAELLRSAARAMGVRKTPRLAIVEERTSPVLWDAAGRGTIVLSREVADGLDDESLQLVLAHEIAHLIRRDGWSRLFAFAVTSLFWWHPVAWLARRELHSAAESCCDELAISRLRGSRRRYAQALLDLADSAGGYRFAPIAAAIPFGEARTLTQRIALVAVGGVEARLSRFGAALALAAATALLVTPSLGNETAPPAAESVAVAEAKSGDAPAADQAAREGENKAAADEIVGVVIDEAGKPLEGVLVDVWTWYPGNETTTDAEGKYRVKSGQPREKAQIRFSKEGLTPAYFENLPQGFHGLTVTLDGKTSLEGTLRGPDGEIVKGATIRADHPATDEEGTTIGFVPTRTTTDDEGHYKLYLAPQLYELQVAVPGVGAKRMPGVAVIGGESKLLDIELEPAVRFEALVVDAETKQPYAGLVLWNWQDRSVSGVSDAAGRIVIDGMLPGDYEFNVGQGDLVAAAGVTFYSHGELGRWWSTDGLREWDRKKIEQDGWQRNFDDLAFKLSVGMKPVTIEVERGVTFSGHVHDPEGKPVAGATVAPAKTGSGNSLTGDTRYSVRTEADGSYRAVMPAGNGFQYNLVAHDGDYEEWRQWANGVSETFASQPGETFDKVDVNLTRPAIVRGRVIAPAGESAAGRQVRAVAADGKENRYYDPTTEVRTDADGTFELKFIRPGKHSIQVEPFWLSAKEAPAGTSVTVELDEGETREGIELQAKPARPAGAVLDFQIQP